MFPLKVLCIDGKPRPEDVPGAKLPKEGSWYTALEEVNGLNMHGGYEKCFMIEELMEIITFGSYRGPACYEQDRFIITGGADEREYADNVLESIFATVKI